MPRISRIRPVLVRPMISGNIGAAARVVKAMGLGALRLVRPHAEINEHSRMMAAGALGELGRVKSCESLDEALEGAVRVFGFSARRREHRASPIWLEEAAADALRATEHGPVVFLFGTERTGLENEELDRAHVLVRIKTSPRFRSLNLAQSVMVTAYELRRQVGAKMESYDYTPATAGEVENCIQALASALDRRDFFKPSKREMAIRRIRDLFGRATPNQNEISLLRGMIRSLDEDPVV